MDEALVVDANPILSALLGGAARDVIFSRRFIFNLTQHTLFEAAKLRRPEVQIFRAFQLLPILAHQPNEYHSRLAKAEELIGGRDPKDIDILALTLHMGCPIWTEDRDFENLPGIEVRKTADLLHLL